MTVRQPPPPPRRPTVESLIILPRKGDADITSAVRKATNAEYIEVRDWKEPRRPEDKRDPRKPYAVIYPRLRVALTNAPREQLESAFGDDSVAPNFPVELPVPPVDLQQTVIVAHRSLRVRRDLRHLGTSGPERNGRSEW